MAQHFRVGIGTDLHRIEPGRRLVLGGVEVPSDFGLAGHSDADVVLHAVIDALFGAAGLPDIGEVYPDTDPLFAGADSGKLLVDAGRRIAESGYAVGNVDLVIHAEAPKLGPLKQEIAGRIESLLALARGQVNVKAKTGESVGPVGKGEAIACTAVALLEHRHPQVS